MIARRWPLAAMVVAFVLAVAACTSDTAGNAAPISQPPRTAAPASIEFRLVVPAGTGELTLPDKQGQRYSLGPVLMDGTKVATAQARFQQETGQWVVNVALTSAGAATFGQVTTQHVGEQLAIVVGGVVVSAPRIQSPITAGAVQITGQFTQDDVTELAAKINGR